ncbi:MAG TPA: hypothetical protein VML75_23260 [Kofleriaceae bacterium]|nr:hypothetical protein [Kofleriaceae bacterium]
MLALDSLVIDLIFQANAELDPEVMIDALGGPELASARTILDPDMQDPRFEMELSPSMPFRRRGERRLMLVDDSVAPMREDPRRDPIVPLDLRPEKERLIAVCKASPIRLGRISALGSWGDAVLVAHTARDLRAICLLPWVLDPTVDVTGKRRANQLTQPEFEEKILAFDKRLDELGEEEILANLGPATFVRDGDLLIVDVLEPDGTWDLGKSMAMEQALAAMDRFSLFPGAPSAKPTASARVARPGPAAAKPATAAQPATAAPPPPAPAPAGPPLRAAELGERIVLVFPRERFDLDIAAALGKRDFSSVLTHADQLSGQIRDRVFGDGADFIAPLEFLSEVFLEGVPLSRPTLDRLAQPVDGGGRALEVHCPRFGPVLLIETPSQGRFISSLRDRPIDVLRVIAEHTG